MFAVVLFELPRTGEAKRKKHEHAVAFCGHTSTVENLRMPPWNVYFSKCFLRRFILRSNRYCDPDFGYESIVETHFSRKFFGIFLIGMFHMELREIRSHPATAANVDSCKISNLVRFECISAQIRRIFYPVEHNRNAVVAKAPP